MQLNSEKIQVSHFETALRFVKPVARNATPVEPDPMPHVEEKDSVIMVDVEQWVELDEVEEVLHFGNLWV